MPGAFLTTRDIFENPIWQNVVEFRLFFLVYGKAAFVDGVRVGDIVLTRGQWVRSIRNLQSDLEYKENRSIRKYSLSTIHAAVNNLVKQNRITVKQCELGTLFTVMNYAEYQDLKNYKNINENAERTESERNANGYRTTTERIPNNNKNANNAKKDIELSKDNLSTGVDEQCPQLEIMKLFNSVCKSLPRITQMTESRQDTMRIWWRKDSLNLDTLREFFERVERSDFLTNRQGSFENCSFDWIIKPKNRQKICEGNYDSKGKKDDWRL